MQFGALRVKKAGKTANFKIEWTFKNKVINNY
jgi:hypothetical protein